MSYKLLCIVEVYIARHLEILQTLSIVISLYLLVHYILGSFDLTVVSHNKIISNDH